jgi:peptidoglycan/xylan/chitin deacetylase (PgdA/CDA1 family)/uncharacterized caspase-like protein
MKKSLVVVLGLAIAAAVASGVTWKMAYEASPPPAAVTDAQSPLQAMLDEQVAYQRKLIVLFVDDATLAPADVALGHQVGQFLFHANLAKSQALGDAVLARWRAGDVDAIDGALNTIESAPAYFAVDRLVFRDLLLRLRDAVAGSQTLAGLKLHKRLGEDLDAFDDIQKQYDQELAATLGQLEARGVAPTRERWDDYVAAIRKLYTRDTVIRDSGFVADGSADSAAAPLADVPLMRGDREAEVFGKTLPPKTIVLTFDDGPHPKYTDEIRAILKRYDVPGTFFQVGNNLGALDAKGASKLGPLAEVDRRLLKDGFVIGNHSFSHAQLTKLHEQALTDEVAKTDTLLQSVSSERAPIFRFPYGARNKEGLAVLTGLNLKSIMWNIDSLDWADPVPASVADRVLKAIDQEKKGIVLFHDIHPRAMQALPIVLDRLKAEGYQFAGWDGAQFSVKKTVDGDVAKAEPAVVGTPGFGVRNWAVVIGIDDYAKWPRLQYATADATSVREVLVDKLGFAPDHIVALFDKDATRANILSTLNTKMSRQAIGDADQIFVFFAGHGATRKLASGRSLGYIIPVDADPDQTATEAIAMTDIQNIAESLGARHVFFVMDACYSGLGLARGGADRFLQDNARRVGRQMLTAGGADQMVADGGPGGHSVFTWTLLQALDGKADTNGDGILTATEIAAYVAPSVAKISLQTPAFGSLPGSEGGDFVFARAKPKEYLTEASTQLPADALALNAQLKRAAAEPTAPVTVTNLEGRSEVLKPAEAIVVSDRQRAEAANNRGLQLYREKQYAQAEASLLDAIKLDPTYAMAANNLGFVYFKDGRNAEAIRWFETTLKLDPSRGVAYLNLGDAQAAAGESEKAKASYRTYLALMPSGPSAERVRQILGS